MWWFRDFQLPFHVIAQKIKVPWAYNEFIPTRDFCVSKSKRTTNSKWEACANELQHVWWYKNCWRRDRSFFLSCLAQVRNFRPKNKLQEDDWQHSRWRVYEDDGNKHVCSFAPQRHSKTIKDTSINWKTYRQELLFAQCQSSQRVFNEKRIHFERVGENSG